MSRIRGRRRWLMAVVAAIGVLLVGLISSVGAAAKPAKPAWLDASNSVATRVNALLHAMNLEEKVGQMDQQLVTTLTDPNAATCGDNGFNLPNPDCMKKILVDAKTGSVLAGEKIHNQYIHI